MVSKENTPGYRAPAVQKAFEILKEVAASTRDIGLSDIARKLGYSKSTTHGLVRALLDVGALDQTPRHKKLFLGPVVVDLAFRSWNYFRVADHAQPIIEELRDQIKQTIFLGVLSRSQGLIVATAESSRPLKISSPPGTTIPLLAGAVGKVFLALQEDSQIKSIINEHGLPRYTKNSILSVNEYIEEINRVKINGYAVDNQEYLPGVRAVAAGVGNHRGLPLAIWVVGFADSMPDEMISEIAKATIHAADALRSILETSE